MCYQYYMTQHDCLYGGQWVSFNALPLPWNTAMLMLGGSLRVTVIIISGSSS